MDIDPCTHFAGFGSEVRCPLSRRCFIAPSMVRGSYSVPSRARNLRAPKCWRRTTRPDSFFPSASSPPGNTWSGTFASHGDQRSLRRIIDLPSRAGSGVDHVADVAGEQHAIVIAHCR